MYKPWGMFPPQRNVCVCMCKMVRERQTTWKKMKKKRENKCVTEQGNSLIYKCNCASLSLTGKGTFINCTHLYKLYKSYYRNKMGPLEPQREDGSEVIWVIWGLWRRSRSFGVRGRERRARGVEGCTGHHCGASTVALRSP